MSDHNMMLLMPDYITKFVSADVKERVINVLDEIGNERLRDCFDCTDWQVFIDSCENLDELTNHVSAYINFCEGVCSKEKTVKCYGNNKPWVSKELKLLLKEKKRVFRGGDKAKIKSVHNQIKGK